MRIKDNRNTEILEILQVRKKVDVSELAEILKVSQVTIRKDLDNLEEKGIIRREHGSAILFSTDDINGRIAYHYNEKVKIAKKAAELVKDGETIMIESGSCCALLAEALCESHKNLTIITNSGFIADFIRHKSPFQTILLGGIYLNDAQVNVGPMVRQCAENFWVDQFFIGVDGFSSHTGFTNLHQLQAQAVRDMAHQTEKVIVLTESEKFIKHGTVPLNIGNKIKVVVTDSRISEESISNLHKQNIEVIQA